MSLWLKIALIALAALLIDVGVSLVPATSLALSPKLPQSFPNQPLLDALFVRPPQAAVNACVGSTGGTLTHDDFVRVAKCLRRKHLVSGSTVAAVERSDIGAGGNRIVSLKAKALDANWWFWLTWGVALTAIAVVVIRHLRRRPPPSPGLGASSI
jgi:hypothetical protein